MKIFFLCKLLAIEGPYYSDQPCYNDTMGESSVGRQSKVLCTLAKTNFLQKVEGFNVTNFFFIF